MSKGEVKHLYIDAAGDGEYADEGKVRHLFAEFASGIGRIAGGVRQAAKDGETAKRKSQLTRDILVPEHKSQRGGKSFDVRGHKRKRG